MKSQNEIEQHRAQKDKFLKKGHQSPLSTSDKSKFISLDYFPFDEDYQFQLELQEYDDPDIVEMDTSDGKTRQYRRLGYLEFEVEGEVVKIHIYQSTGNTDHYFVPFRDETSGQETYGAGRYLDIEGNRDGSFDLDFNIAYNPFCAYSEAYSCPLPPMENWLEVPIRAGEKAFDL